MRYSVSGSVVRGKSLVTLNEGGGTLWVASVTGTLGAAKQVIRAALRDSPPADDYAAIDAAERALSDTGIVFERNP